MSVTKTTWKDLRKDKNISQFLIDDRNRVFNLPIYGGETIDIRADRLLINLILLRPLHKLGILPTKECLYLGGVYTDGTRVAQENGVRFHPEILGLSEKKIDRIVEELFYDTNELSDLTASSMAHEFRSISMIEIAQTMQNPHVRKVLAFDPEKFLSYGLKSLEVATEQHNRSVVKSLKKIKENNCFRPYLLVGSLNEGQFFQSVCLGGTRTDVDDTAVSQPIWGNYIEGLRGNIEYCIESFSARKSDDYNKEHMGNASYTKRKINLMASALQYIYPGDCGTDRYLPDWVPKEQKNGLLGRNVLSDDGTVVGIHKGNVDQYTERHIKVFSPITCNHTDGVCHKCGGPLLQLLPKKLKVGQASTEQVLNPLQQSILSSKHLMKTLILQFCFPEDLHPFFDINDSDIYFEETGHNDKLMIGVPTVGVQNISELNQFKGDTIPGSYFSSIPNITIANNETGEIIVPPTSLENSSKITPYFAGEFLAFLKEHPENITYNGDTIWFSLKGFDTDLPIMGITYVSEAAYVFIKRIEDFFMNEADKGGISGYNDASVAVRDLRNLLWQRISCNSLHVEVLVRGAMITSDEDLSIPVCLDPGGAKFGRMSQINTYRSISGQVAFERWGSYVHDPRAYVTISKSGLFDPYVGFKDQIFPDTEEVVKADT